MSRDMQPGVISLRSLRDRPFELLRELDRRARIAAKGQPEAVAAGAEWVGVAFRLGGEAFLIAREETREVLAYPAAVTRVPGARAWIRGLSNVRGQLLPVIDLRAFLGAGATTVSRSSRVLVANHREIPAGLVVDEVMGFRRFYDSEFSSDLPPTLLRCERYLAGAFRRGAEVWPVFSVRALLESPQFMQAAAS
jgi:twitching motility protein PilI